MERKNPQDNPTDSPAGQLRPTDTALNVPPPPMRVAGVESLPALRAELKQAADEARLGHYEEARAKLDQLLTTLRQSSTSTSRDEAHDPVQMFLLQAAALVACAHINEQLEQPAQAQDAFKQAAALFDQWLQPTISTSGQDYCDYGIALYKLERAAEARAAFQAALKRGVSDARTYYYLGLLAQRDNAHEQAREYLTKAAELEPGDLRIHIALAVSLAVLGQTEEAASTYRDVAFSLYKAKQLNEALTALDLALKVKPDDYRALMGRADLLREQGKYEEALATIEQSLLLQPDNVYALGTKGQILRALQRFADAEQVLRRALTLDDSLDWLHAELAATLLALNRTEEARAPLAQALKLVPDNPFTLGLQAHLLHMLSQYAEAVPIFQRALSADPTQDWVYPELGFDLIMLGQYEEALKVLDNGLARQPQDIASLLSLRGEALRYLNRYEEALPNIEQALTLRPDNPFLLGWQGELLSLLGRNQEAIEVLQRAVTLAPKLDWAYAHLSGAFNSVQRYTDALNAADQALALNTASAQALRNKGEALRRLGRYEEALAALDKALVVEQDNSYALGTKGQVLVAMGRNQEALAPLERAYELDKVQWIFAALSVVRLALERYDDLLNMLEQALAQQPNDAFALEVKGDVLRRLGRYDAAVEAFDRLLSVAPDNAAVLRMKGEVLQKLGRYEEALQVLDRSLVIEPGAVSGLQVRGETLRRCERYGEALQALDAALALVPDDAWTLGTKGQVLHALGRDEEAAEVLQRAVELDASLAWAHGELGTVYHALNRYELAQRELAQALARADKFNPTWALLHSSILCDIAEYRAAITALDEAIKHDSSVAWFFGLKGFALENDGDGAAARDAYAKALELEPESLLWQGVIGNALWLLGRYDEAAAQYRLVLDQAKDITDADADLCSLKGWCYLRLKKSDEAIRLFLDALSLNPDSISDQFNLALTLLCGERVSLALHEYEKGLAQTKAKPLVRQRGLLQIAYNDLKASLKAEPSRASDFQRPLDMLANALTQARAEPPTAQPAPHGQSASESQTEAAADQAANN